MRVCKFHQPASQPAQKKKMKKKNVLHFLVEKVVLQVHGAKGKKMLAKGESTIPVRGSWPNFHLGSVWFAMQCSRKWLGGKKKKKKEGKPGGDST